MRGDETRPEEKRKEGIDKKKIDEARQIQKKKKKEE